MLMVDQELSHCNCSLQGRCVPGCEENVVGMIFYRYMITTGLLLSVSDISSAALWKWIGQPYDFDAPQVPSTCSLAGTGPCVSCCIICSGQQQGAFLQTIQK